MPPDRETVQNLADDLLTFIEQREAEQIAYGIYDVTMTGAEVRATFRPADYYLAAGDDADALVWAALHRLADEIQIMRLTAAEQPADWVFRSRVAEIVRLLTKLKQRIVPFDNQKERHRVSSGKRLVADITFTVLPRQVPRRDIPARACLQSLTGGSPEQQQAAAMLLAVIEHVLPKLRQMSGFQRRALESILKAIEFDRQRGTERGVVVTASTGAGKTYAFFLPVLAKIILERCLRGKIGVKAICMYPRVALSENQLTDFIEILFYLNQVLERDNLPPVTIGIESGAAVYQQRDFEAIQKPQQQRLATRGWTFNPTHQGYESPFAYCVGTKDCLCHEKPVRLLVQPTQPDVLICPHCNKTYRFIQFARDVMAQHPPDILIATTESLNRRLLSSKYQYLFGTEQFSAPCVVMLDEIHLQTSTAGTQVALLLRRLLARIRLGKQERGDRSNLAFVGLSATIAQPVRFLSDLSGLPITRISEVKPQDDEMQVLGAERFIFVRAEESEDTAVISTLIQTAMCVLHTMAQPPQDRSFKRYRTFGFVQSLDVVGRWLYQMQDAERVRDYQLQRRDVYRKNRTPLVDRDIRDVPLYAYRFPPHNRDLFPSFFGPDTNTSCGCEQRSGPDPDCPFFQAGECWWVLSQKDKARREPLTIKRKTGGDRATQIEDDDDLIITTSALEVGYDDEALMCVLQYTAPANVASFVQRKGRGGRKVGTRPLVVTVLSPYKSTDLFLFRNQHVLTDPTFHKLPLNAQNRYLQRIHGFYLLFDWLCYQAQKAGVALELDRLTRAGYAYLCEQSVDQRVLLTFKDYLERTFAIADREALGQVLSAEPDGLLWHMFFHNLMKPIHTRFCEHDLPVQTRDFLRTCVPENLFSDINLPEVQVDYRPDKGHAHQHLSSESISLAISETIPGNVTFRGGEGATWVPPVILDDSTKLIPLARYYELEPEPDSVSTPRLSRRALRLVGIEPRHMRKLTFFRPRSIRTKQFSRDHDTSFWWCNPETGELREQHRSEEARQDVKQLAHSSSAYPISAVDITDERAGRAIPGYTLEADHPAVAGDTLGLRLVKQMVLYSDEASNMNLLEVKRIILGSQYTLKFHENCADEIRDVVGFCEQEDTSTNCALGYVMRTEGLMLTLPSRLVEQVHLSATVQAQLRCNALRHAFITTLTIEHGENFFAAEHLAHIFVTLADQWCHTEGGTPAGLRAWWSVRHDAFNHRFTYLLTHVYQLSKRQEKAVNTLVSDDTYVTIFLDLYMEMQSGGNRLQHYLRDSFQYSISQALKQLVQEVAGVEALNYVAAWTELYADFDTASPADSIWLYEIGMGGIGVMRATHDLLRKAPERFWTTLAHKMTRCPTAQEEALLRYILAQPPEWLTSCEQMVNAICTSRSSHDRQQAIERLLTEVRHHLGLLIRQEHIKALLRVFIPDYTQLLDGHPLSNWQLFREINYVFLPSCEQRLGREPTFTEARAMLYIIVRDADPAEHSILYPELTRLLRLYQAEYGPEPDASEVRQAFENAVERRLLLTCRGTCPNCLDDRSGDIEAPGMSRLLLNRTLLTAWLEQIRAPQTVHLADAGDVVGVSQHIQQIFERGHQAVYLRVPGNTLAVLCATISYLTDAGIDTALGMVYPMITEVQTIYPDDLTHQPVIEVTLRPIA